MQNLICIFHIFKEKISKVGKYFKKKTECFQVTEMAGNPYVRGLIHPDLSLYL